MALVILVVCLLGCRNSPPPTPKWRLENFDPDRGYMFSKDGIQYEAHCAHIITEAGSSIEPVIGPIPGKSIETPAHDDRDCYAILKYLHKPVALEQREEFKDKVFFSVRENDGSKLETLEFIIKVTR